MWKRLQSLRVSHSGFAGAARIPSNESEFATKCAVSSYGRELLHDSGFKLIKSIKLLEVDNDLVLFF